MTQSKKEQKAINTYFETLLGSKKEFEQVEIEMATYKLSVGCRLYVINYSDWGFGLNLKSCGRSVLNEEIASIFCKGEYVYEWDNKIDGNHLEEILKDIDENSNFDCLSDDIDDDVERFEQLIRNMEKFRKGEGPFDEKLLDLVTKIYGPMRSLVVKGGFYV